MSKVSFDMDGTLCSMDRDALDELRKNGLPEEGERDYYAGCTQILDPHGFQFTRNSEFYILTCRHPRLRKITGDWMKRHGLGDFKLLFANKGGYSKFDRKDIIQMGKDKAAVIKREGIDIHLDDNREVVDAIKEALLPDIHTLMIHLDHYIVLTFRPKRVK